MAVQQVIDLLKTFGIDESIVNNVQDRIQAKTKAAKTNSELVAELERKLEESQAHAVELQRISYKKAFEAEQAKVRLDNHLREVEQLKERVTQAYATQMRNIGGGRGAVVEFSGDEEGEDDDEDDESVQMDGCEEGSVSSDLYFADEPREDHIENAKPLPPEGKGDPPPDTILSQRSCATEERNLGSRSRKSRRSICFLLLLAPKLFVGNGETPGKVVQKTDLPRLFMVGESVQSLGPGFSTFCPLASPFPGKKTCPSFQNRDQFFSSCFFRSCFYETSSVAGAYASCTVGSASIFCPVCTRSCV